MAISLGLLGLIAYWIDREVNMAKANESQFIAYLTYLAQVGMVVLFILQLTGMLDRAMTLLLWGFLIPMRMLAGFAVGSTAQGLMIALLLIFTYRSVRRRLPWGWLLAGLLGLIIIRPAMIPLKIARTPGTAFYEASLVGKVGMFFRMTSDVVKGGIPYSMLVQISALRLSAITLFGLVVHETPSVIPYWNGATYAPLLTKVVPRILDKEKKIDDSGTSFGYRYGIIAREQHNTTVTLPQTIELYVNYGIAGVILGSLLFGILYRAVHSIFVHPEMGLGALAVVLIMLSDLFTITAGTSGVLGGEFWYFVFAGLLNLVMEFGELRASAHDLRFNLARTQSS
ncbi:MAG: hypothetical protein JO071_13520 [Deltaproteobacteria bacterium]|nr:hypothetical protein [Deltaproteobacteria bacterium]